MDSLVSEPRFVERPPISLSLHVVALQLELLEVVRHPASKGVVGGHVPEVIQTQVLHRGMITVRQVQHLRSAKMVELAVVSGCAKLKSIPYLVSIELHKHSNHGKVLRRNMATKFVIVIVSVRCVERWFEPVIVAINSNKRVELIRIVNLLQQLSKSIG